MCGIVGRINFNGDRVNDRSLSEAAQSLIHRGPDGTGLWNERGCGLGHTRLSIHNLTDAGHQPMLSSDGRYVCVFNGEIYNFDNLKKQLSNDECHWRGSSDTEVLIERWLRWGVQLLDQTEKELLFLLEEVKPNIVIEDRVEVMIRKMKHILRMRSQNYLR